MLGEQWERATTNGADEVPPSDVSGCKKGERYERATDGFSRPEPARHVEGRRWRGPDRHAGRRADQCRLRRGTPEEAGRRRVDRHTRPRRPFAASRAEAD